MPSSVGQSRLPCISQRPAALVGRHKVRQTGPMPELPEVTALAAFLTEHAGGRAIAAVTVASLNVLTTYDPPAAALVGRTVAGVGRHGKFLDLSTVPGPTSPPTRRPELHLLLHLARAGWLRWSDAISPRPPKMGGPISLRVVLGGGGGFDVTEAGTKKSVTAAVVTDPRAVPGVARLGPDALGLDRAALGEILAGQTGRIKNVITDQTDHRRHRQRLLRRDPAHRKAFALRDGRPARPG